MARKKTTTTTCTIEAQSATTEPHEIAAAPVTAEPSLQQEVQALKDTVNRMNDWVGTMLEHPLIAKAIAEVKVEKQAKAPTVVPPLAIDPESGLIRCKVLAGTVYTHGRRGNPKLGEDPLQRVEERANGVGSIVMLVEKQAIHFVKKKIVAFHEEAA
jgi:hypothetical protein